MATGKFKRSFAVVLEKFRRRFPIDSLGPDAHRIPKRSHWRL